MASGHRAILEDFGRFRASWPRRGWSFDNRFECVASSFAADFAPEARKLLARVFPHAATEGNLATASAPIREIAARTGAIRAGQFIIGADPVAGITPYGLWWPWEEAQTISIRIGLEGATASELDDLCTCFGAVR